MYEARRTLLPKRAILYVGIDKGVVGIGMEMLVGKMARACVETAKGVATQAIERLWGLLPRYDVGIIL